MSYTSDEDIRWIGLHIDSNLAIERSKILYWSQIILVIIITIDPPHPSDCLTDSIRSAQQQFSFSFFQSSFYFDTRNKQVLSKR